MKRQAGLAGALASVLMTCVARADFRIASDRLREMSAAHPTSR
jgi:hypothetical protein